MPGLRRLPSLPLLLSPFLLFRLWAVGKESNSRSPKVIKEEAQERVGKEGVFWASSHLRWPVISSSILDAVDGVHC